MDSKRSRGEVKIKTGQEKAASAAQADKAATEGPRADYVFIMGRLTQGKRENPFYKAEKYFRIHYPKADIITQERTLDGLLSFIDRNIDAPIGNLFIVSRQRRWDVVVRPRRRRSREGSAARRASMAIRISAPWN